MVHPVLQDKIIRDIKKRCSHISDLSMWFVLTAVSNRICTFLPDQVFDLKTSSDTVQVHRNAGITFMPPLEFYPRNLTVMGQNWNRCMLIP